MRLPIFLAALMGLALSVFSAADPSPELGHLTTRDNITDDHPLCGGFAWWNNGRYQEEKLWETRTCLYTWHNVGRVNVADWSKCELCFFFP